MKGCFNILFGSILIVLVGCQNNSEKLIQTKISNVDNTILISQPHKSNNHGRVVYASQPTIINTEYASDSNTQAEQTSTTDNLKYSSLSDEVALSQLFFELSEPTQHFTINPAKDTLLVCAKGTVIEISAGSLVYKNDKLISGLIRLQVTEYLKKTEFLYASLSTKTNKDRLLESGGTLLLKAYSEKEEVFIAKGKSIQFQIPTNTIKENMKLFSGVRDVHGSMKWYTMDTKENKKANRKIINAKKKTKENQIVVEEKNLIEAAEAQMPVGISELHYYIFNTAQLGWINVDRFLHLKGAKGKFALENMNLENSKVSIVFKNYDAVLPGFVENGKVNFEHIPLGEEITIVAIKVEKGIPMLYIQDVKTERGKFDQPIEFKAISFADLKEEMKKINRISR
jgi:hypothetical protein